MKLISGNPGLGLGESDARYLRLAGGTLTGALVTKAVSVEIPTPAQLPAGPDANPGLPITQAWTSAGLTWTAALISVTDTASASGSKLIDAQVGGASKFSVTKAGVINGTSLGFNATDTQGVVGFISHGICDRNASAWAIFQASFYGASGCFQLGSGVGLNWRSGTTYSTGSVDTGVQRNSAGVLEVNNGTSGTLRDFKCRRATVTEYQEVLVSSEPSAPASGVRLWADLSGGKVFLMARFPTGASQVVAQEP
jgi:hypothetical protein